MGDGPVFIGGLSYSGKTPLRLMLTAHPNLNITRRTRMWTRFYGRFGNLKHPDNFERCLEALLNARHIRLLHPDAECIRREFKQGTPTYARLFGLIHAHYAEQVGKPRWGDQLGSIEQYAGPIFAGFPNARMIHMIRDPREKFKAHHTAVRHRRGKVGFATAEWRHSARLAQQNQHQFGDRYLVVRFEDLLSHTEKTVRTICTFLEESFYPDLLVAAEELDRESGHFLHSEKLDAASSLPANGRLSPRELAFMQAYAGSEMARQAYQPTCDALSITGQLLYRTIDWPVNLLGMLYWHMQQYKRETAVSHT